MVKLSSPHDMFVHLCFIFYVSSLTLILVSISGICSREILTRGASIAGMLRMRISSNTIFIVGNDKIKNFIQK